MNSTATTNHLKPRERALTALGAALASNCVPCLEYQIPAARKAGLSDAQIREAVTVADKVRRVPADKAMQTAQALLERCEASSAPVSGCGCVSDDERGGLDSATVDGDSRGNCCG